MGYKYFFEKDSKYALNFKLTQTCASIKTFYLGPNLTPFLTFFAESVRGLKFLTQVQLGCEGGILQIKDLLSNSKSFAVRFWKRV